MLNEKEIKKSRELLTRVDKNMVVAFKALSDVNRFRIFCTLVQHPKLSVTTLSKILDISLPLMSQHIKVLAHAHLVQKERTGKRIFSKLKYHDMVAQCITTAIKQLIKTKMLK